MIKLDALGSADAPAALDLQAIEEPRRAEIWARTAGAFFPGLSVCDLRASPSVGSMRGRKFGSGQLWTILSPPVRVSYVPTSSSHGLAQTFSLMLQLQGSTLAAQDRRSCLLRPRDVCMIDGRAPFELEVHDGISHLMFVQIPRHMAVGRYPYLEKQTAAALDRAEPGTQLLSNVLSNLLEAAPFLEEEQCAAALVSIAQLLGVPKVPMLRECEEIEKRVHAALAFIDSELADPGLTASRVAQAQGISRRRLDEILLRTLGTSVTAQIWNRRLAQAASDLLDPRQASKSITQIAFGVGFADTAHFTRAFKRRYHCTPREWRSRAVQ